MKIVKLPTKATLKKYGLTQGEWLQILESQDYKCPVCGRDLADENNLVRLVIDHAHVKGYAKKSPEDRKLFVRGILDTYCNFRVINKNINLQKAKNIVTYLEKFEDKLRSEGLE